MNPYEHCARLEEKLVMLLTPETRLKAAVDYLCAVFRVLPDEVAVFSEDRQLDRDVLRFLWPPHLATSASGYVPLSSEGSLAVRTFLENKGFINLTFASTQHACYFEILPIDRQDRRRPPPIQKIISAPARHAGGFQGVIQVSHKGSNPEEAGPDFVPDDLDLLNCLAAFIAAHL